MHVLHELFIHDARLKQLHLQNFRGFGNVTLGFHPDKPVTVLIADNGGGKSTVLDAAAEFLRRFFQLAIVGKSEEEANNEGEDGRKTHLGERDIFNERTNASASAVLDLYYPYPHKEVFEWMDECARYLDDNHIEGKKAILYLEEEVWTLQLKQNEDTITYYLPEELQKQLDVMASDEGNRKILSADNLGFEVAVYDGKTWRPHLALSSQETNMHTQRKSSLKMEFELTRGRPDPIKHYPLPAKPNTYADFIKVWNAGEGFISDYAHSTSRYNRNNPIDETPVVLPLLVYYGGAAINAKYDNELKVPYRPGEFQAYLHAFEPNRFDFEEFLAWALWVNERQKHAWDVVKDTILDVLNADTPESSKYDRIEIEAQTLVFYKKTGIDPSPIEAAQLSAGEQNIMALVSDLAKRAVQLNPILFKVDVDPEAGTLSNPMQYTPGIVLIDEIDLHLHPRWQRVIIPKLREHFPRVQFVVTTHSPFVLQAVPPSQRIRLNDGQPEYFENEPVSDYESTLIDYFMMHNFFDVETEKKLKEFRHYLREVATNRRDKKDPDFVKSIKVLREKGDVIKRVIAVELAQLTKKDTTHDEN